MNLLRRLLRITVNPKRGPNSRALTPRRPALELLENRCLLTPFYWWPEPGSTNWADPRNWLSYDPNTGATVSNLALNGSLNVHLFPGGSVTTEGNTRQVTYTDYSQGYPPDIAIFGGINTKDVSCTLPALGGAPLYLLGLVINPGAGDTLTLNAPVNIEPLRGGSSPGPNCGMVFDGAPGEVVVNQELQVLGTRFVWESGWFTGRSIVNVTVSARLYSRFGKVVYGPTLNLRGTTFWSEGNILVGNGSTVNINGTFHAGPSGGEIEPDDNSTDAVVVGSGGIFESAASGTVTVSTAFNVTGGSVQVVAGTLTVAGSAETTSQSGYSVASGASLYFQGSGKKTFGTAQVATQITGGGTAYFNSNIELAGNLSVQNVVQQPIIPANLTDLYNQLLTGFTGWTVSGRGSLTVNGTYSWLAGSITQGTGRGQQNGTLTIAAGGLLNVGTFYSNSTTFLSRPLVNNGRVAVTSYATLSLSGNATVQNNNHATFDLHAPSSVTGGAANTFTNSQGGTVNLHGQNRRNVIQAPFENQRGGRIVALSGSVEFAGFQLANSGDILLTGGSLIADNGVAQTDGSVTVQNANSLSVTGTYALSGGKLTVASGSSFSATALEETGGTAFISGSASITAADVQSGTLHVGKTGYVTLSTYTEARTDPLVLDLDSTSALVQVSGTANLAGGLTLNPLSGFDPSSTSVITLISNTGSSPIDGVFNGLNEGSAGVTIDSTTWDIFYDGNSDGRDVVLEVGDPFSASLPVANSDSATAHSAAVTVSVLANDYSPEEYSLTVTGVGTPTNGTAVANGNNTVTYTPASGATASADEFTYTIADGHGGTSTGTVNVSLVDTPPVANDLTTTNVTAAVTLNPLANDYSPDGDSLTVTSVGTPLYGTAALNGDSTVTYTPSTGAAQASTRSRTPSPMATVGRQRARST